MSTLSFALDVVARGDVLGADHTCTPDQVSAILEPTPAENRQGDFMWRDHGLVEFFWERGDDGWRGTHFTVQLHRLASIGSEVAAGPIEARYGPLEPALPFEALRVAAAGLGIDLVRLPSTTSGVREYWQPRSMVLAIQDDTGEVYALTCPYRPPAAGRSSTPPA
ncbi:hypothetical protein HCN51_42415 [Nonomuraea sp. FMUSA5-5]|uniref:Uncharacterized protein n=1 Tax=Nonomuraea composti TaxID=2720023 RepID=A0ABX1BJQ7_9ACTN|nr:hypothetical protein [Nonomuraea sp. FMUSA5-5]NJP96019.1 hypothetical protein [Nonomuraea sp. FMUSA5-5]